MLKTWSCGCGHLAADTAWLVIVSIMALFSCEYSSAKRERRADPGWKRERKREGWNAAQCSMPSALTYPSGVSYFFHSYSPYWPLPPSSLDLSGPFKPKVMLLACVMNLPPDPEGACWGLAHRHVGTASAASVVAIWPSCFLQGSTIWVTHQVNTHRK